MNSFFISIGSNVEPQKNVPRSIQRLKSRFRLKKISPVYETDPVGPSGSSRFWNLAALLETNANRESLSQELRKIEGDLGRKRKPGDLYAPRAIDLDLLPQPNYQTQNFIMIPLADIAPSAVDAESGKTFGEIAESLKSSGASIRKIMSAEELQAKRGVRRFPSQPT